MIIGYARVSTKGQNLRTQIEALKAAGCEKIYKEKLSGADNNRPQFKKALASLSEGDVLIVVRLSRLARSAKGLLEALDVILSSGAKFRSLSEPWCDTTTPEGKFTTTVMAGMIEFQRNLILETTAEGREAAQEDGVKFGRPSKLTEAQKREVRKKLAAGEKPSRIAALLGVHRTTISRLK